MHLVNSFSTKYRKVFQYFQLVFCISCTWCYQFSIIILNLFNFIVFSLCNLFQIFFGQWVSMTLLLLHHPQLQNLQLSYFLVPGLVFFLQLIWVLVNLFERIVFIIDCNCLIFLWNFSFLEIIDDCGLANFVPYADTSNYKAATNNTFGSGLLESILCSISFTNRFL